MMDDIIYKTLHEPFDIETHKKVFVYYLEVIIDADGIVHYAVPSHSEWLIAKVMETHNKSRDEIIDMCPPEYAFNPIDWLTSITGCISVWDNGYVGDANDAQLKTLTELRDAGLYRGKITH